MLAAQLWKQALMAMAPLMGFLAFDLELFPRAATALNGVTVRFGTAFLLFINLLVPPVVAFSVIIGIVSNSDLRAVRRVDLTAIATYACTTVLAVTLGTMLAALLMPLAAATLVSAGELPVTNGPPCVMAIVREMVLRGNLINPFQEGNLLQIITIAVAVRVGTMAILNMAEGAMVEGARVAVRMAD